ncbi:hypothetical protein ACFL6S_24580 [Candidatus Poribacteria bacterium]
MTSRINRLVILVALIFLMYSVTYAQGPDSVVFRGRVVEVGDPPNFWSGTLEVYQKVIYDVVEVQSGSLADSRIEVYHLIIRGSPDVEPGSPRLAASLFAVGNELIVRARVIPSPFDPLSGQTIYRALPPTERAPSRANLSLYLIIGILVVLLFIVIFFLRRRARQP